MNTEYSCHPHPILTPAFEHPRIPFSVRSPTDTRGHTATYANGQCQLSSAAKADLCLSISVSVWVPKMTNRLYTVERKMKQHKIPLGFESSNCSDETAAVLCCNQRNEYTIPIVTLTCNHARQFRTTRTP